jgi:hypothetical protein
MGSAAVPIASAAVSGVAGAQQQKKLKTNEKNRKKELLGLQQGMLDTVNQSYAEQLPLLKQAGKAAQGGYLSMIADANRQEGEGMKGAERFFQQALGSATGNAASRGLLGSSVNANMRLGAARQASLAMTDAQLAASKLRSSAQIGLGQAKAGGLNALAGLSAYRAGGINQALLPYFGFLSNVQYGAQQPSAGNLGSLMGSLSQYKQPGTV